MRVPRRQQAEAARVRERRLQLAGDRADRQRMPLPVQLPAIVGVQVGLHQRGDPGVRWALAVVWLRGHGNPGGACYKVPIVDRQAGGMLQSKLPKVGTTIFTVMSQDRKSTRLNSSH